MVICVLHGMQCWPNANSNVQHQLDVLPEKHHIPVHQQGHQEPHADRCLVPQLDLRLLMCWSVCLFVTLL